MSVETDPACKTYTEREREREREGLHTDKVSNIEGVVVGPKGVVDAGVPAAVGTNNVVGSKDCWSGGDEEDEEDEQVGWTGHGHALFVPHSSLDWWDEIFEWDRESWILFVTRLDSGNSGTITSRWQTDTWQNKYAQGEVEGILNLVVLLQKLSHGFLSTKAWWIWIIFAE